MKQDLAELHELMSDGQLNPPINRIAPESIPGDWTGFARAQSQAA